MRIHRSGTWLYDGTLPLPVDIIGLPYDFWHEIGRADDQLEPGELPSPMGDDEQLYYVRFRRAGELDEPTWPDSGSYNSIVEDRASREFPHADIADVLAILTLSEGRLDHLVPHAEEAQVDYRDTLMNAEYPYTPPAGRQASKRCASRSRPTNSNTGIGSATTRVAARTPSAAQGSPGKSRTRSSSQSQKHQQSRQRFGILPRNPWRRHTAFTMPKVNTHTPL